MKVTVNDILIDIMKQKGVILDSNFVFKNTILNNYWVLLAKFSGLTLIDNSTNKTDA